jgi:hypothetical protein
VGLAERLRPDRDTWLRHELAAGLLAPAPGARVVDVGGIPGRLSAFLPGCQVVAVNVEAPADVLFDGVRLPFTDGEFECGASLDVLEHLAPSARPPHVDELLRVTRRRAVLCCPLGTPEHVAAEALLADWHAELGGARDRFLDEHREHGLPTEPELRTLSRDASAQLMFHGDVRTEDRLFRLQALAHFRRRPSDRLRLHGARATTPVDRRLCSTADRFTNRAYLVADPA